MNFISEDNHLQHYGVPGMKWGKRKARGLSAWGKEAGKATKNNLLHPLITSTANRASIASEKTLGAKARRTMLYQNTKDLKDVNRRIDSELNKRKSEKIAKNDPEKIAARKKKREARMEAGLNAIGKFLDKNGETIARNIKYASIEDPKRLKEELSRDNRKDNQIKNASGFVKELFKELKYDSIERSEGIEAANRARLNDINDGLREKRNKK